METRLNNKLSFVFFIVIQGKTLIISHSGTDSNHCGHDQSTHCRTIGYVLTHRVADNDIIRIINNKISEPFTFNRSFPLSKNLSLVGVSGWPTILAQTSITFLFEDSVLPNPKFITIQITNLIFKGCGIIHLTKSFLARNIGFQNCHFENVLTDGDMIRIENQASPLQFYLCYFINNTAKDISRLITIVYSHSAFKSCYFVKNKSTVNGSIAVIGGYSLVKDSKFERNTILGKFSMGGAIYTMSSSFVKILNCSFQMNRVTSYGGAISHSGKKLIVELSSFQNNDVSHKLTKGGAIYVHSSSISNLPLNRSIENKVDPYSKVINEKIKILLIRESSFLNNSASEGGALSVSLYRVVTNISSCIFQGNTAMKYGGAIQNSGKELHLRNSYFDRNNATNRGGAVCSGPDRSTLEQLFIIETSALNNNSAYRDASAIYATSIETKISNSIFKGSRVCCGEYHNGGAIFIQGEQKLKINKSLFQENSASGNGGALYTCDNLHVILKASFFENNNAGDRGGGIHADTVNITTVISNCTIKGNTARNHGGAICSYGKDFFSTNVTFQNNSLSGESGQAGALYLYNSQRFNKRTCINTVYVAKIINCTFDKNKAPFRGGAIVAIAIKLLIRESVFLSSSYVHYQGYSGGEFLYSMSEVTLEQVSFHDLDNHNLHSSLITHQGEGGYYRDFYFKTKVLITCLTSKHMEVNNQSSSNETNNRLKYTRLFIVSCSFCPRKFYSLSSGFLSFQNMTMVKTHKKCYPCPLGGVCENGTIRASANSWGYNNPDGKLRFTTCPFGYCCSQGECKNYSSCIKGRIGRICGQCEEGLTENLMTPDCLPFKDCHHPWFLLVAVIVGMLYVFVFMYMNETVNFIKTILITKKSRDISRLTKILRQVSQFTISKLKKIFTRTTEMQYLTNDVSIDESNSQGSYKQIQRDVKTFTDYPVEDDNKTISVFPGLLKIIIFFYQTNLLFKIQTGTKSHRFIHLLQEVMSTTFNLRVDGIFAQDLSWCPVANLRPVSKLLLKNSFVFYLFILVILTFVLLKLGKSFKIIGTDSYVSNKSRLLCCSLRLILISYAGITKTCFSLLSCIQLDSIGRVLFIDGSITCYNQWQMIVIFIVSFWVCPFPIAIYTSSYMLRDHMLSTRSFLLCLMFPAPSVCYWMYVKVCGYNKTEVQQEENAFERKIKKDALEIMEGPFRNSRKGNTDNKYRLCWEGIFIGRRLALIFLKTFVINTFARLSIMLWCTVLFLVHHIYIKPFARDILNNIETVSLLMLIGICFLNLIPAYYYAYPSGYFLHVENVMEIQQQIEAILNLVFPSLVIICGAVLVAMKILKIILSLCRSVVILVRYVMQKLS